MMTAPHSFRAALLLGLCIAMAPTLSAQGFLSLTTVHFNVKYQGGVGDEQAKKAVEYLEDEYSYLNRKLGVGFDHPLEVRMYESVGRFRAESGAGASSDGAIVNKRVFHIEPLQTLAETKSFEKTISYHLALAMLDEAGRRGCPVWLRQAFAVYHCGEMPDLDPPVGVRVTHFADLDQDIQQYTTPPQRDDVHYVLGLTMKFFVDRCGEPQAFGIFRAFTGASTADEVIAKAFGRAYDAIEKEWSEYIAAHTVRLRR